MLREAGWEAKRLETLAAYDVLDSPPEESIDRIAQLAATICATPIALVTLVAKNRQWFKSRVGLDLTETDRALSFCAIAVERGDTLIVKNALVDERFAENALVTGEPHIRFYAGIPVCARNGLPLGTLCVIDRTERTLSPDQLAALEALAREVEGQLELRRMLALASKAETERQELALLVVHDLRTPVSAMLLLGRWLRAHRDLPVALHPAAEEIVSAGETVLRMAQDLVDVTRSETGTLEPVVATADLRRLIDAVVGAMRVHADSTGHHLVLGSVAATDVETDGELVRRMLTNMVENALKYAPRSTDVTVHAELSADGTSVHVSVLDEGPPIPPAHREELFDAGVRCAGARARESLGLGLRFCRIAANSLGGRVWADETLAGHNAFHLEFPRILRGSDAAH